MSFFHLQARILEPPSQMLTLAPKGGKQGGWGLKLAKSAQFRLVIAAVILLEALARARTVAIGDNTRGLQLLNLA